MTDWDLLDAYVSRQSEAAFARLVERHWRMVLAVCRREVGDACLAEDAAQAAFLVLARRAGSLRRKGDLASWLFVTARFTAKNAHRLEVRRKALERSAAQAMEPVYGDAETAWPNIEPYLNEAIASLRPQDRAAVLLCYFEGFTAREAAAEAGITEAAVRTRLSRAIERMRKYFHQHGLFMTNMALASALIDHQGALEAPSAIAAHVAKLAAQIAANPTSVPASSSLAHLLRGAHQQMVFMKLKLAVCVTGAVVLAGVGTERVVQAIARNHSASPFTVVHTVSLTSSTLGNMTAPIAAETASYKVADLYTGGPAATGDALPTDMAVLTDQGEVSVTRTTADPTGVGGYRNYVKINMIVSAHGVRSTKEVSVAGTDGAGGFVGSASPGEVPALFRNGHTTRLAMPSTFQFGSASCIVGDIIGGEVVPWSGRGHCCLWKSGKFVDLDPFIPADIRSIAHIQSVDTAGDVLLYTLGPSSRDQMHYMIIRSDRTAVALHADAAFLNRHGRVAVCQQKRGSRVRIHDCATGQERIVPALANLISGGVADFNDKGEILYETGVAGAANKTRYYVLSGHSVTQLMLPDKPMDFVRMNNRRQIAGRITGSDNKQHIVLFSPN